MILKAARGYDIMVKIYRTERTAKGAAAMRKTVIRILALAVCLAFLPVSACAENSYGHPHAEVLNRLRTVGAKVLRTDLQGSIRMISNGETIRVE